MARSDVGSAQMTLGAGAWRTAPARSLRRPGPSMPIGRRSRRAAGSGPPGTWPAPPGEPCPRPRRARARTGSRGGRRSCRVAPWCGAQRRLPVPEDSSRPPVFRRASASHGWRHRSGRGGRPAMSLRPRWPEPPDRHRVNVDERVRVPRLLLTLTALRLRAAPPYSHKIPNDGRDYPPYGNHLDAELQAAFRGTR